MLNKYRLKSSSGQLKVLEEKNGNGFKVAQSVQLSIITQFHPPDYAATGQLIAELAQQLGDLGMNVSIFTGQPGYAFDKGSAPAKERLQERVFIQRSRTSQLVPHRIRGRVFNGLSFCFRAGLHLLKKQNRQDLLLLTTEPPYLSLIGFFAHLCFGLPYVCLLYDLYPDVAVELKVVSKTNGVVRFWDWLNRKIWQRSKAIIVLSSTMKDRIVAKCPEVEEKIKVIHSWSDPKLISPLEKQQNWFAHQFDMVDKFTVLYSGNMGRCHDMDTIMEAAYLLKDDPVQFVFIGHGAKRNECMERVQEWELENCRFLPYQEKSVLPFSLTACDLSLVSMSPGMEGLVAPSKLYGILASGRPVAAVCEAHSYLRPLLAKANCGETFDNEDAVGLANFIRRLAQNQELAEAMGQSGRTYLESHFTPEIIAGQYFEVFSQSVDRE